MTTISSPASLIETARAFAPQIREQYDRIENERRLPPALAKAIAEAGLFRLMIPKALGGLEVDVETGIRVFEEMSRLDGSVGWCTMIGATGGLVSAYLPDKVAQEIYGSDPHVVTGGALAPTGKAVVVDGGYRVTGRWQFNSGCQHCTWLMGTCVVVENGTPRRFPNGQPVTTMLIFPAKEAEILDTWSVLGLRGSGSHDIAVSNLFVPEGRVASLLYDTPHHAGPLYRFPMFGLLALSVASVGLGMARGAIDSFVEIAKGKSLAGIPRRVCEREVVQMQVAQAEASLRAGRAFLYETLQTVWKEVLAKVEISVHQRALLRLAATHAATSAAHAIDLVYHAAGTSSIWANSPLQRHFRDVHVLTQHAVLSAPVYELAGRVFFGLKTNSAGV
jgi:alkylation response protein AidB-like acyl-CoA dehydrogenase